MKIFLSCASAQFKECRDAIASDLRAVGSEVIVQEDFTMHPGTLLAKLEGLVASCDRFIALIGDCYGAEADPHTDPRRSYSQWEYAFAQGERLNAPRQSAKPIYPYFASADYLAKHPVSEKPEATALQQAFIQSIFASNKDRKEFSTIDRLCAEVLRDGFRLLSGAKPQNLPYPTLGKFFVGREDFIRDLKSSLAQTTNHPTAAAIVQTQAVHGLGGIGKTRLAVEYAWQNETNYTALLFVLADSPENLRRNLAALAGAFILDLPEKDAREEEARAAAVVRWLEKNPGWFLILDNVDTPEAANAAENLLAKLRHGHILITTRLTNWSQSVLPVELNVLTPEASKQFLLDRTTNRQKLATDEQDAESLAADLDGLALALEQAGAYIQVHRISLADYLKEWRAHNQRLHGPFSGETQKIDGTPDEISQERRHHLANASPNSAPPNTPP